MLNYEIEQYSRLNERTNEFLDLLESYSPEDRMLIEKAYHFSCEAHSRQKRKATYEPYVIHCIDVACYLMEDSAPGYVVAAGLLHDTVEDIDKTGVGEFKLRSNFPKNVSDMVMDVTERDKNLPWIIRKRNAIEHAIRYDYNTKHLKCADKLSNIRSMIETDRRIGSAMWKMGFRGSLGMHKDNFEKLAIALSDVSGTKTYKEYLRSLESFLKI